MFFNNTVVCSTPFWNTGDVIELETQGDKVVFKRNGVPVAAIQVGKFQSLPTVGFSSSGEAIAILHCGKV